MVVLIAAEPDLRTPSIPSILLCFPSLAEGAFKALEVSRRRVSRLRETAFGDGRDAS